MKILNFPELRQTYNYDCGACAVESILDYYGTDVREDGIMSLAGTVKEGTSIIGLKKVLEKYGLKYKDGQMTVEDIKKYLDKDIPVILVLQAWTEKEKVDWKNDWADGHYVIAIGYDGDKIIFEDPSAPIRTYLTTHELMDRWHDGDKNKKLINWGMAVYGKKPKFNISKMEHMD